jgi:hypothetical protein
MASCSSCVKAKKGRGGGGKEEEREREREEMKDPDLSDINTAMNSIPLTIPIGDLG